MAKDEHSAIPSWSGYIYQGKVAIYHVLRIIKDKFDTNTSYTFNNYELEVEWQEDFAILINGVHDTLHQVKAYEDGSSPTVYNKALTDLFNKLSKGIGRIGYLNIQNPIGFTPKTKSKDFEELKTENKNTHLQSILDQVKIYEYCNGDKYCDLDDIDILILQKIEEIYVLNDFEINSKTMKQYEFIRYKIYDLLDTHILEIHKDSTKKKDTIPFDTIINIFKNNYEEYSLEYQYIKVKDNLFNMIGKYCNDSINCDVKINDINCANCSLYQIENELEKKSSKEVYECILQSTPHFEKLDDLLNEDGLILSLSRIFHDLDIRYKTDSGHYKKNLLYLPTTIHGKRKVTSIAMQTLKNKNLDSIVKQYEIDIFISDDVDSDDLLKSSRNSKDTEGKDIDDLFGKERRGAIDKIRDIKIKPLDDIKGELQ